MPDGVRSLPLASSARTVVIEVFARKVFLSGLAVLALLAAANIAAQFVRYVLGFTTVFGFIALFDADAEGNLPTMFSVFLLACCSALLCAIGASERGRDRRASRYWLGLGAVTGYVAIDEGAQIHEPVGNMIHAFFQPGGYLYFAWVIPGMAVLGVLGIVFFRFVMRLERPLRSRILTAALLYVGGGLGMELLGANRAATHGMDLVYAALAAVEETLEEAGALVLPCALLLHAADIGLKIETVFGGQARAAQAAPK
ncbi:MAG: hypothetical protein ACM3S5_15415 [Rhodospirillales bacterium]